MILSLYRRIPVSENPYSCIFYAVGLHFAQDLSPENSQDSFIFLTGLNHLRPCFNFLLQSPSSSFCLVSGFWCYFITWMMFSYVFVFGDFNAHHKGWLTYSSGTIRPRNHIQMFNFPTQIPHCDSHLFISSDPSICSTVGLLH